jgi:hypothetical protein
VPSTICSKACTIFRLGRRSDEEAAGSGSASRSRSSTVVHSRHRSACRVAALVLALILLSLIFGSLGHAQPSNRSSYQLGGTRYYQGTDQDGLAVGRSL